MCFVFGRFFVECNSCYFVFCGFCCLFLVVENYIGCECSGNSYNRVNSDVGDSFWD